MAREMSVPVPAARVSSNPEAAFWDRIAEKYSRQPVRDPAAFERKIAITQQHLTADATVLDIGCGTGSLALRLAPSARQIHGLDVSGEMVRIARGKADAARASNVSFHVGKFDDGLPLAPQSLDGVCAYSLLHLLEDPAEAIDRIYRLLKPGGFFIASTVCLGESFIPFGPLLRILRFLGKAPFVQLLTKQDILQVIQQRGFVDARLQDVGAQSQIAFTVATKPLPSVRSPEPPAGP